MRKRDCGAMISIFPLEQLWNDWILTIKLLQYILEFSFSHKHSNRNVVSVKALLEITSMKAGSQRVKNNVSQRDSTRDFVVPVTSSSLICKKNVHKIPTLYVQTRVVINFVNFI